MSKPIFAVFGATGNQGNSAANFVLSDPELSQRYTVRAVSRDTSNPKMQALKKKGAELAQADLDDPSTLPAALTSVSYLFFITMTQYQGHSREIETRQARSLCTAALAAGVKYIIFSSMSHPFKISSGALQHVEHFDAKAEIEQYIRSLPVQSSFFAPASFMQNFATYSGPKPVGDGSYAISNILHPHTKVPFIDIADTGKWIGAILAEPDKFAGKFFAAGHGMYTMPQACELMSRVSGKTIRYVQVSDEVYKGFLTPVMREPYYEMWVLNREYGYYGEGQEELVEWAKAQARGEVTGLEEWLVREKFDVE